MKKVFLIILTYIVILGAGTVNATKMKTLYEGVVPVKSQSSEERNIATQKALMEVLIKVSGNDQIINNPRIRSRLVTANHLIQEYGYEYPKNRDNENRYLLQVHFDKSAVNQWLRDASAPIWGQNRPPVFAWIVSEKPNMIQFILNDTNSIPTTLQENAARRGIPLLFPIKNPPNVLPTDVMSMAVDKIISATKRYSTLLIGYMQQNSSGYVTQWKLVSGKDIWDFNVTGPTETEILEKIMDQTANTLAGKYAVVTTNNIQKNIELRVVGISEQTDFAKLIRYLSRLTPVASVSIAKIDGNEILLNVSLRSTEASFTQAISLSQKLLPIASIENNEALIYQWNPSGCGMSFVSLCVLTFYWHYP